MKNDSSYLPMIGKFWILLTLNYKDLFTKDFMTNGVVNIVIENALKSMWSNHLNGYPENIVIDSVNYWISKNPYPPKINELIDVIKMKLRISDDRQNEVKRIETQKAEEVKSWTKKDSENISEIIKKAKNGLNLKPVNTIHPEFDSKKIDKSSEYFDLNEFNRRKNYLMSVNDYDVFSLSHNDAYDRIRYLREVEAMRHVISMNGSSIYE